VPWRGAGPFYLWRRRLVDKHRARRPRSSRTLSGATPGSRAKSAATSRSSKISAFCAGKKLDANIESQHQWRGEKRGLRRAPSRGGSTRGVPSAVIATPAKSVARAQRISVLNSHSAGSLAMSKACSMLRALYTDRRERTQPHQYLAGAGDDQHAAIGLGQRGRRARPSWPACPGIPQVTRCR